MPEIPTMSLKVAPMQFATFTPTQYTPQAADATLLSKSMAAQEARQESANKYLLAIDTTLAEKRKSLNKADYDWLATQAEAIRGDIDKQIELGNWQTAIRLAQQSARDLTRNTELDDRIRANEVFTTERNKIQTGNYNEYTKRRWDAINKYRFNGTADWTPTFNPVADMSVADIWNIAVSRTPIRSKGNTWSKTEQSHTFIDNQRNLITDPTEQITENGNTNIRVAQGVVGQYSTVTTQTGGGSQIQEKRQQDIVAIFNNMLKDENIRAALRQQYDNMLWLYSEANKVLSNPNATADEINQARADLDTAKSSLSTKDGFLYVDANANFEGWVQAQARQYAKDSAYVHTQTNSSNSTTTSYNNGGLNIVNANRNAAAEQQYSPQSSTTAGPTFIQITMPQLRTYSAPNVMQLLYPTSEDKESKTDVQIPYAPPAK